MRREKAKGRRVEADLQHACKPRWRMAESVGVSHGVRAPGYGCLAACPNRPLAPVYAILYLDAIHIKLKRDGKIDNVAVYNVLGVDLDGHREILGNWIGDGAEGANFWLSVITDLQNRSVEEVFMAAIDGLTGFKDAIHSVFPKIKVQRCVIHQTLDKMKAFSLMLYIEVTKSKWIAERRNACIHFILESICISSELMRC